MNKFQDISSDSGAIHFHNIRFEKTVREILDKSTGDITYKDVESITKLDLTAFYFEAEDLDTLCLFHNLEELAIEIFSVSLDFVKCFPKLVELDLTYGNYSDKVDFSVFSELRQLESLVVSGGDYSSIDFINTDNLVNLSHLRELMLHEFGTVDLKFLEAMPWLKEFYCGYAIKVDNIESIGSLINLTSLTLIDIEMKNLDFLEKLPTTMFLDLCGDEVSEGIDSDVITRFAKYDVCEMTVNRQCDPVWYRDHYFPENS